MKRWAVYSIESDYDYYEEKFIGAFETSEDAQLYIYRSLNEYHCQIRDMSFLNSPSPHIPTPDEMEEHLVRNRRKAVENAAEHERRMREEPLYAATVKASRAMAEALYNATPDPNCPPGRIYGLAELEKKDVK